MIHAVLTIQNGEKSVSRRREFQDGYGLDQMLAAVKRVIGGVDRATPLSGLPVQINTNVGASEGMNTAFFWRATAEQAAAIEAEFAGRGV